MLCTIGRLLRSPGELDPLLRHVFINSLRFWIGRTLGALRALLGFCFVPPGSRAHVDYPEAGQRLAELTRTRSSSFLTSKAALCARNARTQIAACHMRCTTHSTSGRARPPCSTSNGALLRLLADDPRVCETAQPGDRADLG